MYSIVAIAKAKLKSVGLSQVYFVFLKGQFFVMKILLLRVFNIYIYIYFKFFEMPWRYSGQRSALKNADIFSLKNYVKIIFHQRN